MTSNKMLSIILAGALGVVLILLALALFGPLELRIFLGIGLLPLFVLVMALIVVLYQRYRR